MLTAAVATAAMAIAVTLVGCTPEPEPTPAPSGFADEDAAFAAAEATYRAYVDALNRVDLSDPETFEDVYRWTTGDALAAERKLLSEMHAEAWIKSGATVTTGFARVDISAGNPRVVRAIACSDISEVDVKDAAGVSQVASNRPDSYQLRLEFTESELATFGLLLSSSTAVERTVCP